MYEVSFIPGPCIAATFFHHDEKSQLEHAIYTNAKICYRKHTNLSDSAKYLIIKPIIA